MPDNTSSEKHFLPKISELKLPESTNNQTIALDVLACEPKEDNTHSKIKTIILNDPCWLYLRLTIFILLWIVWFASWMIKT